ncbi:hypothetical protein M758_6G192900 [Ceratodon purpureus]|nr:hypothetical protein M758_6G192900 [Ceratodon purpureus]
MTSSHMYGARPYVGVRTVQRRVSATETARRNDTWRPKLEFREKVKTLGDRRVESWLDPTSTPSCCQLNFNLPLLYNSVCYLP